MTKRTETALIVGAGSGLSASLARLPAKETGALLLPDEIAKSYLAVYRQHRSAWSWELKLRPWVEKF